MLNKTNCNVAKYSTKTDYLLNGEHQRYLYTIKAALHFASAALLTENLVIGSFC